MFNSWNPHQETETPTEVFGFIFNLDGAVIDTEAHHTNMWQKVLAERGTKQSLDELAPKCYGSGIEIARRLFGEQISTKEVEKISQRQERIFQEQCISKVQLISGLKKFLEDAKSMRIPMALTSDYSVTLANALIEKLGLKSYFSVVVGGEEVDRGRPNPDILLKASLRLGLMPEECVLFDSSNSGIEAAQRAGVRVLTVQLSPDKKKAVHPNPIKKITDFYVLRPSLAYSYSQTL